MAKTKIKFMIFVLLISTFVLLPSLLVDIQGDNVTFIDGKKPNEILDGQIPQESSVYYEETTGQAWGVYVSGDFAYLASYFSGLAIIDISNPTNPGAPIYEATAGNSYCVYVSGDYAYVADGNSGLAVIDISDPTNPSTPVYEPTTGTAYGVYVSGDYAYVANGYSGLAVIDISDPTNPGTPIYESTTGSAYDIYVSGDYAYIADRSSGLAVIDISNPTNPGTPFYEDTTGNAQCIYVSGDYAYVADYDSGLAVIDISDPTNPGTPVYEDTSGDARGVYVDGNYAYVTVGTSGLAVVDVSNPTNPGTPVYEETTGLSRRVYISGDRAYVADYNGLAVIDISEPIAPENRVYEDTTGIAYGVYVSGDYAYIADAASGLAVADISDPTNPGTPVYEDTTGEAYDVYVSGDYAYLADYYSGLAIIDISEPTNPGTPVYEDTLGQARSVYVSGDYAYVGTNQYLAVIDISDPTNPGTPVYKYTTGFAFDVYVSGDYAYVADYDSGLAIIDISDPTNPGTPVYANTTGEARGVYISGNYAYVADSHSGLAIIDVSDPTSPGMPIYAATPGLSFHVYVSGDYAYVADGTSSLAVIDISDPINPGTPVYEPTTEYAYDVYVSGDYAYVADYSGLVVIQIRKRIDMEDPIISNTPNDFTVQAGYTEQILSWTATDANPDTYTIELIGTGIVAGPTAWTSGNAVTYNIPDGFSVGSYIYTIYFLDDGGRYITDSVNFTVEDTTNPTLISAPSDLTVEHGYTGQSLSWTATDPNPDIYTIELQGTGVAGPTAWTSGNSITYNIPDGFIVGSYIYTINFTDDYGNSIIDSVTFTVDDTSNPIIISAHSDLIVEFGYTTQSLSWTATDSQPNTYTIELQGSGIITGPTAWTSGVAITYNIPDGFGVGSYTFTINITDDSDNFIVDNVTFSVEDTTKPIITSAPSDLTVEYGYVGQSFSWTVTDLHPDTYTIEVEGFGIIKGPTAWNSGTPITYYLPNGFTVRVFVYIINFTDDYGNSVVDSVTFTIEDTTNPVITVNPNDLTVEYGYTGQNLSWTATDPYCNVYTIELQGSGIMAGPTAWTWGETITYNIPDGFGVGSYVYTINFTDDYGHFITDSVLFTVEDTSNPNIINPSSDLIVEFGYTGQNLSWTAIDANPDTYTIELQGSGILVGPTAWISGVAINYNIQDGFAIGVYVYTVNFTDDHGNSIIDSVTFTVEDTTNPIITSAPSDLTVELGYTGQSFCWTATDLFPDLYTIELQGTGIVAGPTIWVSGNTITYNIPDGLSPGVYIYEITFIDESGNPIAGSVTFTVLDDEDTPEGAIPLELITIASVIGGAAVIGVAVVVLIRRKRTL